MNRKHMFKFLALSLLVACTSVLKAQDTTVYAKPQKPASFPGGNEHLFQYLGNNLKYRDIAVEPAERRVLVIFVVEADGSISNAKAIRGGNDSLRQEAVRIMKVSPKWEPAYKDDKPVRSSCVVVIGFGKGEWHDSYSDEIYTVVDRDPEFFGGKAALDKFIAGNLQYPQADRDNKISGTVTVGFIVEKDGRLTNIKALDGPTEAMKKEAVRVMALSPRWRSGVWEGNKFVRVQTTTSVPFKLQ